MLGCKVSIKNLPGQTNSLDAKLFSESQGRVIVSVSPKNVKAFEKIMNKIACVKIGKVSKNNSFIITDRKEIVKSDVKKLHTLYHSFSNKNA